MELILCLTCLFIVTLLMYLLKCNLRTDFDQLLLVLAAESCTYCASVSVMLY